jgi:hypothetical protein
MYIYVITESWAGLETYNVKVCMSYTFTPEEETGLQGFKEI